MACNAVNPLIEGNVIPNITWEQLVADSKSHLQVILAAVFDNEFKILAESSYNITDLKKVSYTLYKIRNKEEVMIKIRRTASVDNDLFLTPHDFNQLRNFINQSPKIGNKLDLQYCQFGFTSVVSEFYHITPTGMLWQETMGMQKGTIERLLENHDPYMKKLEIEWLKIVAVKEEADKIKAEEMEGVL